MANGYGAPGAPNRPVTPFPAHHVGYSPRVLPHNPQAEQALLGALLANNKAYDRVAEILAPEHFADAAHGYVYRAIARRIEAGQVADVVSLRPEFENSGLLAEVGGPKYLVQLLAAMVGIVNAAAYAREIVDAATRRAGIEACEAAVNQFYGVETGMDAPAILEELDGALTSLALRRTGQDAAAGSVVADELFRDFDAAVERRGGVSGLSWGYRGMDRMTGGMHPGQLILLAARPGMGKTAAAGGIAARVAAAGGRVYFWGGEMARGSVMSRLVAADAGRPLEMVTRGGSRENAEAPWRPIDAGGEEWQQIRASIGRVGKLPITWDDQPGISVSALRARLRQQARRGGLDLVVIDYVGLLRASPMAQRAGRYEAMTEISLGLKELARELRVPLLVCAQLNREVTKRENKRPIDSDLRDAGQLEQDADCIVFIHREHHYLINQRPERGKLSEEKYAEAVLHWQQAVDAAEFRGEFIIAKQRQGVQGPVRMRWSPRMTWFFDESDADDAAALPGGGA